MPRGDGTRPNGLGPMTGMAAGYCAGYSYPGFANSYFGRGFGWSGRGRARRFRNWSFQPGFQGWSRYQGWGPAINPYAYSVPPVMTASEELDMLKNQAKVFHDNLDSLNQRIEELENSKDR